MFLLLQGTEEGVEVAKTYRNEFKHRIDNGIYNLTEEKHRLLWIQNRIQFKTDLI